MAKLFDAANNVIELSEIRTNRIGTADRCDAVLSQGNGAEEIHAGIKSIGNAWYLLNLTSNQKSVRHKGHVVADCVEMGHNDNISICGTSYRFKR